MSRTTADPVQRLAEAFDASPPKKLGVAVSGGGDSVALLCLLADWAARGGPSIEAVTVDHGLRPEAAQEALGVAEMCAKRNIPHTTLEWGGWDGQGNLPDQARRARYRLMADWAAKREIPLVALGHTSDDVAETFLMRLSRGSGLNGLSAMTSQMDAGAHGVSFVRPLLGWTRAELRADLTRRGQGWVDDPSNDDDRFERVRMRKALAQLETLGITAEGIADTARRLRDARDELSAYVLQTAEYYVTFDHGDLLVAPTHADEKPLGDETLRRILSAALIWVSGSDYAPRGESLGRAMQAYRAQQDTTLHGCRLVFGKIGLRVTREWKAVTDTRAATTDNWDGRWALHGPHADDLHIAALGEVGLPLCPDRKATGRPAASLISSPAIWRGDTLVAAPLAGLENGWSATLKRDADAFNATLLSH